MVYKFKLVSDEVNNFVREIEIGSNSTFLQLRNAILDSVGYAKNELDSFFLCNDDWEFQEEIAQQDMGSSSDQDLWIMADTPLSELIEDEGQRLAFVFDYFTERAFFMELKRIETGRTLDEPKCTVKKGNPPAQSVDIDEFNQRLERENARLASDYDDMDTDQYNDSGYNDEELNGYDQFNMD